MMKKALFIALAIGMMGCNEQNVEKNQTDKVVIYGHNPLQEIKIEGCQYLFGDWGHATVLTHKGNCNNPIHIHNGGNNE